MKNSGLGAPVVVVLAIVLASANASLAIAKVHVEPNGPAGQQYALPLDSARGQGSGQSTAGVPGSSVKPPLFGEGIHRAASNGQGKVNGPQDQSSDPGKPGRQELTDPAGSGDDEGSSVVPVLVVALAVAGLGCAAGLIARRRLSAEPHG